MARYVTETALPVCSIPIFPSIYKLIYTESTKKERHFLFPNDALCSNPDSSTIFYSVFLK